MESSQKRLKILGDKEGMIHLSLRILCGGWFTKMFARRFPDISKSDGKMLGNMVPPRIAQAAEAGALVWRGSRIENTVKTGFGDCCKTMPAIWTSLSDTIRCECGLDASFLQILS